MPEKNGFFRTFCRVSRAFGTTLERESLLNLIVESAIDTMGGKASCLFLEDEDKKKGIFVPIAQKGLSRNYLHAEPKEAKRAAQEILKKGYIAIHDAATDPRVQTHEMKKKAGIASILVVPVLAMDRVIGVLALYTEKPRIFTSDEIEFLSALAEQGGMAIERARLIEQIRKNTRLFHDLSERINSSLDIGTIMDTLSQGLAQALGVKAVSVRLLDKDRKSLRLVTSYGLSRRYLDKVVPTADKGMAEGLNEEPVVIKDVSTDKRVLYREEKVEEGICSILSVPIKAREDVIGVLMLYSGVPRDFAREEILLAAAIAHQGGLAIRNASLYLMLKEDMQCLKDDLWSHKSWF